MPNWCEGHLRIKGDIEDITRFLKENIVGRSYPMKSPGYELTEVELEDTGYSLTVPKNGWLYFKNSPRLFPVEDVVYLPDSRDDPLVYVMPIKQAWSLDLNWFEEKSVEYNLHMKIDGYDEGAQFAQFIEIKNGIILRNETIEYGDWYWDCPCPLLGG